MKKLLSELKVDTFLVNISTNIPEGPLSDEFKEQITTEFTTELYKLNFE